MRQLDPIAILCSDLHLSHKPPLWRSAEPDWYAAQDRPLSQLRNLSSGLRVPVVIAGDIFDDGWRPHRCPPELINFAMRALPAACYAIPGQHDLPYHRYEDRFKSAYWTLVEAKTIVDLHDGKWLSYGDNLILHGFPWNCPIIPNRCKRKSDLEVHLVVAHAYIWIKDHGFPGAKEEHHARSYATALQTYDAAVFGDNHKHFHKVVNDFHLWNNGTFMRRKSDEKDYQPAIGILTRSGKVIRHELDVSQDKFLTTEEVMERVLNSGAIFGDFAKTLENLGEGPINFSELCRQVLESSSKGEAVRNVVIRLLGGSQ